MKRAFITGITGQDGAYLAALLLDHGYDVIGGKRRVSTPNFWRLEELGVLDHPRFALVDHDLTDPGSSIRAIEVAEPDEVYNLGAQSFVAVSFDEPDLTAAVTGLGSLRMLEAIRTVNKRIRFYQASSAEMFGKVQAVPQSESTPFYPRSPYGVAKTFAHWSTVNYRESYGMFACSGILFNHESPLRGPEFVTRKITRGVARIIAGRQKELRLGNLEASRDWGYAADYVDGMRLMLQAQSPDDYVLATGVTNTVRSFVESAFGSAGVEIDWEGAESTEVGRDRATGQVMIRVDPAYFRPAEVDALIGDASKARRQLGWSTPTSISELGAAMVAADLRREGVLAGKTSGTLARHELLRSADAEQFT